MTEFIFICGIAFLILLAATWDEHTELIVVVALMAVLAYLIWLRDRSR